MWKDTEPAAYVQLPDDVGRSIVLKNLLPIWTIVLAIAETLCVQATELTLGGDVVQAISFHIRSTCGRRQQELPQTSLHSRGYVLPKEFAVCCSEGLQHAAFFRVSGIHGLGVISTHIDHIAGNHWTAKRLVSQLHTPDDISPCACIPVNGRIARRIAHLGHCCLRFEGKGRRVD